MFSFFSGSLIGLNKLNDSSHSLRIRWGAEGERQCDGCGVCAVCACGVYVACLCCVCGLYVYLCMYVWCVWTLCVGYMFVVCVVQV